MTWVEALAEHEQFLIGLVSVIGVVALALAYALILIRRGTRGADRPGDPHPRR